MRRGGDINVRWLRKLRRAGSPPARLREAKASTFPSPRRKLDCFVDSHLATTTAEKGAEKGAEWNRGAAKLFPPPDHETAHHRPRASPRSDPDLQEMPQAVGRRGQNPEQAEARTQATPHGEEDIAARCGKLLRNLPEGGGRAGERAQPR